MVGYRILDSFPFPDFFAEENYYAIRDLPFRDNDLVLSTYPKCGTNWVAYIMWSILHPQDPAPEGNRVMNEFWFVDKDGLRPWTEDEESRGRKIVTHLPPERIHHNPRTKYVAVVRNPMDCCVSFFHFFKANKRLYKTIDGNNQEIPTSFLEAFVEGKVAYGDFFQHLKSWYSRRQKDNVHLIVFEKLKANPKEEILNLARFLGQHKQLEANCGQLLDKIVEQSSFSEMQKNVMYFNSQNNSPLPILRKGEAGGYRSALTNDQIQILKEKMEQELEGTDILETWRNV